MPNAERPTVLIAHHPKLRVFDAVALERLGEVADVLDPVPVGSWDDDRAGELLARAQIILGHWACPVIDASIVAQAPRLGLIAYAAGTVKATITRDVFETGVRITSGAAANAEPVAEYTLAMILLANKDVLFQRDALRTPRDDSVWAFRQPAEVEAGNYDKTIGIVGASLIGRRMIELLGAFPHLDVALYDPFVPDHEATALGVTKYDDLVELCAAVDVLSIHAPDLPSTRHMIAAPQLAALRTGATVINTARGALVDHEALLAELETGRLSAVLDVTDPEPLPDEDRLWGLPNVVLTPHIAGSQGTELRRMVDHAIDEIERWRDGRPARNAVTADQLDRLA